MGGVLDEQLTKLQVLLVNINKYLGVALDVNETDAKFDV